MSTLAENPSHSVSRAVVLKGRGTTRLETLARPHPGPGEILLELRCCGLCGTDLFKIDQVAPVVDTVLGHEVVGTVTQLGKGVESFSIGDRVVTPHHVSCGHCHLCRSGSPTLCEVFRQDLLEPGGFSEFFVVRSRAVDQAARRIPDSLSDEVALFLEPAACVLRGIDRAGLPDPQLSADLEQIALILGAGSMGLLHLLVLRSLYPHLQIVISDPLPRRRETAIEMGATAAAAPDAIGSIVFEHSRGSGADCVFDTVGRPDVLRQAIGTTREGATLVLFAHAKPEEELIVELNTLFKSERRLVGTYSGGLEEQARVWDLLVQGQLDPSPLITHTLPLSRFSEGVDLARGHQALKVVFIPAGETSSASA